MLEKIRQLIKEFHNRELFFMLIGLYYPIYSPEYRLIEKAYNVAKEAFRGKFRDEGVRYFEHLRAVALILIVHVRVLDANIIAAALLHDIMEDIPNWTQERLAHEFNELVAMYVFYVSEPPLEEFSGDKQKRSRAYHHKLAIAPREAILVKLADRLHNVVTLWHRSNDNQRNKVRETQDFYLPLAEKFVILVHELEEGLEEVMLSWKK